MVTIALINQKGGVGKTTSTVNLGAALLASGQRVLVIDLDAQAHLTYALGIAAHEQDHTIYDVLRGDAALEEVIVHRDGLDVVCSSIDLSGADIELSGVAGREFLLREALEDVGGYDFVLIDCPPNLGLLTLNALATADEVYIPVQAEFLALQGMSMLLQTIQLVQKRLNGPLDIGGVLITRFDGRKNLNREVVERVEEYFGDRVLSTPIRDNISLAEAPSHGQTIFEYAPKSYGAEDYGAVAAEILSRHAAAETAQ